METIDYARACFRRKWHVIPLKAGSKVPALARGHSFLTTPPTKADYAEFDLTGNYGVVCGAMSGIAVLDVDLPEGVHTIDQLDLTLPATAEVNTPNGKHYFLKYDSRVKTGVAVVGKGIDIRSDGSFVVGPGSVVDGKRYEWHTTPEEWGELADAPDWMMQDNSGRRVNNSKVDLSKKLGNGERNNGLTSIAGKLLYGGTLDEGLVYNILSTANREYCDPPLDEWEVEAIFNSIRRYNYD